MKSFDDIINGDVNEGLAEKWKDIVNGVNQHPISGGLKTDSLYRMLLDIMIKLDEIDKKVGLPSCSF